MQTVEPWLATFEALNLPALFLETGSAAILRSTAASDRLLGGPRASGGYTWLERIHPEDRLVLESALRRTTSFFGRSTSTCAASMNSPS